MMNNPVLAVDGGGTKCKATLYDTDGQVLAEATNGPANLFLDFELAVSSILQATTHCLDDVNTHSNCHFELSDITLSAGCAGANIPVSMQRFDNWQSPFANKLLTTDLHISCLAANNGEDCGLVIVGTGSAFAKYETSVVTQLGGHGFILGDIGSGAWIGKTAITLLLRCMDKVETDVLFERTLLQQINCKTAQDIIARFAHAPAAEFASFAPVIFGLAEQESPIANMIISNGVDYICRIMRNNRFDTLKDCYIVGGLAEKMMPLVSAQLAFELTKSDIPAEYGAFLFAKQTLV